MEFDEQLMIPKEKKVFGYDLEYEHTARFLFQNKYFGLKSLAKLKTRDASGVRNKKDHLLPGDWMSEKVNRFHSDVMEMSRTQFRLRSIFLVLLLYLR